MVIKKSPLISKNQTGRAMYRLVERFHGDIGPWVRRPLPEFYGMVGSLPYLRDRKGTETIARPLQCLRGFPAGIDCKKKAILIASWLRANGFEFRFIACSERPDGKIHHVFPQGRINGKWRNLDATYSRYKMFERKPRITRAEVLRP